MGAPSYRVRVDWFDDEDEAPDHKGRRPERADGDQKDSLRKAAFKGAFGGDKERGPRRELISEELGFGNWSLNQIAIMAVLAVVLAGLFVWRFGSDPATITDRVKDQLGASPTDESGSVAGEATAEVINVRLADGTRARVHILALEGVDCTESRANREARQRMRPGSAVVLRFDPDLGRKHGDDLQARVSVKGREIGPLLAGKGLVKVSDEAGKSDKLGTLTKAEARAKKRGIGAWKCDG